ncbi:MAG TPA: AMP-binding protein [Gemmatimonadaceae bacterium]|nr:AMP-binding protein [Gemmatimonadaceae bacterium]
MAERPWLAHYDADVPKTLAPYPPETLVDMVRRQAAERPAAAAVRFEGAVTTFAELLRQASAFGRALEERGLAPGDRVALILPNTPQFPIAEIGTWMAGGIVAPMNPTYPAEEMAGLLGRSGATIAVVLAPFYDQVKAVQPRTSLRHVIVAYVRDALAFPKSLLFRLFRERHEGHGTPPRGDDEAMGDVLAMYAGQQPRAAAPSVNDPALLLPSGGTTGTPKLVIGTHGGLAIAGRQLDAWLGGVFERGRDTLLVPLPLFHVYAGVGVQALAYTAGLSMALIPNPRDTAALLATIRRERPAFLVAVPGILAALAAHKDTPRTRDAFHAMKLVFSGAAPLLIETSREFQTLTGGIIVEGYSLTEAQMAVTANPARGEKKIGSVGVPVPDVEIRLVDIESGTHEVPPGDSGEVLMAAPQLMRGYWGQPEETTEALQRDENGRLWLHTGDVGYLDPEGYLFLTARKKELIKVSGYQVWPREVEEVLATHPAVAEVGVAAIQDPVKGERPKAWVVLRPGMDATPEDLRAYCAVHLAPYKVPVQVAIAHELPKSPIGKVLRRKLHELDEAPSLQTGAVPVLHA